jgi:RNA polymerase sigma-70 factor (ECF subfamily)
MTAVLGWEARVRGTWERGILRKLRRRQHEAYEAVVDAYYGSVHRLTLFLTGDAELAEDLTQEVFASAWDAIDRFQGRASVRTWLHRIAYHCVVDARRRRDRERALTRKIADQATEATDPVSKIVADERLAQVYAVLSSLSDDERALLVLHYIEGLSYREVATILDRPNGTVKWLTSRALEKLRKRLVEEVDS